MDADMSRMHEYILSKINLIGLINELYTKTNLLLLLRITSQYTSQLFITI